MDYKSYFPVRRPLFVRARTHPLIVACLIMALAMATFVLIAIHDIRTNLRPEVSTPTCPDQIRAEWSCRTDRIGGFRARITCTREVTLKARV